MPGTQCIIRVIPVPAVGRLKNKERSIAGEILSGAAPEDGGTMMTRKEAAACLQVTADTLRNWELNGLLTVKRRQNGYRVYSAGDIRRLRIIRALRCAN